MKQIRKEDDEPRTKVEELVEIMFDENASKRKVLVGALLEANEKKKLVEFLKNNQDIFAWLHEDMPRIDPNYMCHELNVYSAYLAMKQKHQCFSPKKNKAINKEVD